MVIQLLCSRQDTKHYRFLEVFVFPPTKVFIKNFTFIIYLYIF